MPHLYDPWRHERLCEEAWNPRAVQAASGAVVGEVLQAGSGPTHPGTPGLHLKPSCALARPRAPRRPA